MDQDVRSVFFDLDGCLVDSRAAIAHSINHALTSASLPRHAEAALHRFIGPPLLSTFVELLTHHGRDPSGAHDCVAAYRDVYGEVSLERTVVVPGVGLVLERLAGEVQLAVVTSKPAEFAEPILASVGLDRWFSEVFAPPLDALEEPKAAALERALAWAGVSSDPTRRSDAWMCGDRYHDIEAGRACGTATVGVTWGIGDRAELEAAGADAIVDDPADLVPLLTAG
ncbi:HAD hydrolase-like protein [Nitriliruptor alkaliphilus]|uniref:HAD hydrolase-like protein n=1 Tax=Nitriliruptor alkaliphilus TaxID=427918 RepID=UPI0006962ACD|nr:HAD hydrolase-like protein [Nitriliruptor alkaliphilus]